MQSESVIQEPTELVRAHLEKQLEIAKARLAKDRPYSAEEDASAVAGLELKLAILDVESASRQQQLILQALNIDEKRSAIDHREMIARLVREQTYATDRQTAALLQIAQAIAGHGRSR